MLWRGLGVMVVALAATLAGAPAAARADGPSPHVVGGVPADPAPSMVAVRVVYPFGGAASCGGTLVAARYVVTAGHCVASDPAFGGDPVRADVVIGAADLATDASAERMTGAAIVRNPAYSTGGVGPGGTPRNDVAVLRLPVPSAKPPARLPRPVDGALWAPGVRGLALGYGLTNGADSRSSSNRLLQVDLPIVADDVCRQLYGTDFADTELCAGGEPGKDTCQGDSGGPLLVPDAVGVPTLAGITSFGNECGRSAGVYTEAGGPVNGFLRSVIPQVELDVPATAVAGRALTLTAAGSDPDGAGPFGGYDALAWDLDADGAFDDAAGATATLSPVVGANVVSVLATDAAGNRETRTMALTGERLAPRVGVRPGRLRVRGGRFVVAVTPNQAGRVTVTARRGTRLLGRSAAVRFAGPAARRVAVRLTTAGRRALRDRRRVRVVVRATLSPQLGGPSRTARRTLRVQR